MTITVKKKVDLRYANVQEKYVLTVGLYYLLGTRIWNAGKGECRSGQFLHSPAISFPHTLDFIKASQY